ncbi:MAG TPA: thioredoxin [Pyrinomonadaceae bacterium]|nr:thioredoxin [Pyrinomonadaceae bacterium]
MSEHVLEVTDNNFESDVLGADAPVLVDFWAPWCGPCRMLAPTLEALAKEFDGAVRIVKLNVDDNPSTSQRYGIKGIPTLILFRNGTEEERVVGVAGKESLAQMLRKRAGAATA